MIFGVFCNDAGRCRNPNQEEGLMVERGELKGGLRGFIRYAIRKRECNFWSILLAN